VKWTSTQRRAWDALGLGPVWELANRSRGPAPAPREREQTPDVLAIPDQVATPELSATPDQIATRELSATPDQVATPELSATPDQVAIRECLAPGEHLVLADPPEALRDRWQRLEASVAACRACPLGNQRTQAVFSSGSKAARWAIVGEAPGADEDAQGEAFVGQAGRLLDAMLLSMGWSRAQDFFITNVLKCRPPHNRTPLPPEMSACAGHLQAQLQLLAPRALLILGRIAAQHLLPSSTALAHLRLHSHSVRLGAREVPAVVTFHPAYLLRYPQDKAKAWEDLHRFADLPVNQTP